MKDRVQIQDVVPAVDCGRYPVKAVTGEHVVVGADVFREGHEPVLAAIRYRGPDDGDWREAPMRSDLNDRWYGHFPVTATGPWRYTVIGWTDHYGMFLSGLQKKFAAGQTDLDLDIEEGALLLERRAQAVADVAGGAQAVLTGAAQVLRSADTQLAVKVDTAGDPDLLALLERHPERLDASQAEPLPLWVDRQRAQFAAWYEMFPRSEGATATTSGTFAQAAKRLPAIAEMGFDIVYLPPIHPVGRAYRKGPNNTLVAGAHDPGVPWAIGNSDGGHKTVHPDLGTLEDFEDFVAEARRQDLEVALDFAIQCSPDHPWVREHPQWFKHRPDGSIAYAENPPKKYQDIYPIDFDTADWRGLWEELRSVVEFWISHGVRTFRVDNPHTKALPFWEWLISGIHERDPGIIFLSEAFTRPKMMQMLAKIGFNSSYTYFAWRNTKHELTEYLNELTRPPMVDYFRPNFWPNTPDILTDYMQHGGPAAFRIRLVLAALMSPAYGIYSGYELYENTPLRAGSEEYLHSEKYQYRPRNYNRSDSLAPYITRVNRIRTRYTAFRELRNLWFHHVSNDNLLAFSKVATGRTDAVLVIVNLDPHSAHEGMTWLDLWQLGLEHAGPYEAHDLMTDTTFIWNGPSNYVRLDPFEPAHVLALRAL